MGELGPLSDALHEEMGHEAAKVADYLFTIGDEALPLAKAFWKVRRQSDSRAAEC